MTMAITMVLSHVHTTFVSIVAWYACEDPITRSTKLPVNIVLLFSNLKFILLLYFQIIVLFQWKFHYVFFFFLNETCTVSTTINSNLTLQHLIFRNPRGRIMFLLIIDRRNRFFRTILRARLNALTFKTCFVEEDCTCSARCFTTFDSFLLLRCLIGFSLRFRAYSLEV